MAVLVALRRAHGGWRKSADEKAADEKATS
jgi:hypothetical protein